MATISHAGARMKTQHCYSLPCSLPACCKWGGTFIQDHLPPLISVWPLSETIYFGIFSKVHLRSCGCSLPGSVQEKVGWISEQPGLVQKIPAHRRKVGTRWSFRSIPTQATLWFYKSTKKLSVSYLSHRELSFRIKVASISFCLFNS